MWSVYVQLSAFLALGIYLGDRVSAGDALIFILALLLTSGLRKLVIKKFFPVHTFVILMAAIGILLYHYHAAESVRSAYPLCDKYVTMLGKVTDLPDYEYGNYIYIVDVKLINYLDKDYEVSERVRVKSPEEFKFGDSVRIEGFLKTFPKKLNGGDYDTGRGYKAKGIYFKTFADSMTLSGTSFKSYSVSYFFTWIKSKISDRIYETHSGDEEAILRAALIGYKDAFSEEFEEELNDSNTMRMFYPSYMHISFIIMLVGLLGAYVKKDKRDIVLIILLVLYGLFNSNSHYILKTALVTAAIVYSKKKIGFSNYMDVLALVVGIMLIIDPLMGYETGFILSVAANILIFYFLPFVSDRIKWVRNPKNRKILALGIVLSIGLLPLQAYFFNVTTPYAFLLNFIYMPLLSLLWILAPLGLIFEPVLGSFNIFGFAQDGIIFFLQKLPGLVKGLPFYSIPLPRPGILAIAVFYLALYVVRKRFYKKQKGSLQVQIACAVILGFLITGTAEFISKADDLEITFVNVGQGDGAVLKAPFGETVIIDGGGSSEYSDYDYGEKIFLPYLKREGYNNIDLAVVSHYHSDHCKGVIAAMKKLDVEEVLMPDCMEENEYRKEIEQIAEERDIKLSYFKAGARLRFGSGLVLDIISPDEEDIASDDENDTSMGIRVEYGDFKALFTGDITSDVEENHLGEWGHCNVLKVPHHGSKTSSGEDFLDEVSPDAAVFCVGEDNSYSHPDKKVLQRYRDRNIQIYRTDLNGDIKIYADKEKGYKISTYLE